MDIKEIISRLGGVSEAARRLGLKRTTVQMWVSGGGTLPPKHALAVSRALKLPVEDLLPSPAHQEQAA